MKLQLSQQPLTYGARYFDDILDAETCRDLIIMMNQCNMVVPSSEPWFRSDVLEMDDDLVANSGRWQRLDDALQTAVGTALQKYVEIIPGAPLGKCMDVGYYIHRTKAGGYLSPCTFNDIEMSHTILHVSIFLNDNYEGGYTRIEPKGDEIEPAVGRVVVVPATWLYAVAEDPVTSGTKYKVDTCIRYAPPTPDNFDIANN